MDKPIPKEKSALILHLRDCIRLRERELSQQSEQLKAIPDTIPATGEYLPIDAQASILYGWAVCRMIQDSLNGKWHRQTGLAELKGETRWFKFVAEQVIEPRPYFKIEKGRSLGRKFKVFERDGVVSLLPTKFFGRANNRKMTLEMDLFLTEVYQKRRKVKLTELQLLIEQQFGVTLSVKTIGKYFSKKQ